MSKLFDDNDRVEDEEELKINSGYANNYNNWRQKEEINKLKTKYGEHIKDIDSSNDESSSSSEDDEDGNQLTQEFERDFFKTLACLKRKDPKIYDNNTVFFSSTQDNSEDGAENDSQTTDIVTKSQKKKEKKEKPLFLRDYERKILIERDGILSDSEDESGNQKVQEKSMTYVEEQKELQESIKKALRDSDDEENNDEKFENSKVGGFLKVKTKSKEEKIKEEESYKEWLAGQTDKINETDQKELKCLRDFWSDPNLNKNEKFLRDYVLNKKFLEKDDDIADDDYHGRLHDSDENLSEDEKNIDKQEEFEHKYNFRFEEPDFEFIKRYPRTMENTLRKKDTRRAQKRAEVKKRKEEEKLKKKEELKQLKALKRKEIMDKIAQLKEITGNDDINLDVADVDGDFDPEEHDKKMQEIFNDDYYQENEEMKPEFPDLDEELEIERNWDSFDPNVEKNEQDYVEPHCEDPEFIMDADYDPNAEKVKLENELIEGSKRKRRRKSKFAKLIATPKPKFDPTVHKSFMNYFDQYYALDYEDLIGDIPCRFKYRKVVPNDYGLTTEEILLADDKELNKWCSLKKALEHKPENVEMREVQIFQQKAKNEAYKRKILASLYRKDEDEKNDGNDGVDEEIKKNKMILDKMKGGESNVNKDEDEHDNREAESKNADDTEKNNDEVKNPEQKKKKKRKKKKKKQIEGQPTITENLDANTQNKANGNSAAASNKDNKINNNDSVNSDNKSKKRKRMKQNSETNIKKSSNSDFNQPPLKKSKVDKDKNQSDNRNDNNVGKKQKKNKKLHKKAGNEKNNQKNKNNNINENPILASMSDERFKAYGINPKKFKNKLKYGNPKP